MDIEQKTDLTYIRVEEIDKKINKVISDVNNLSPFSDDSNNSEKITTLVSDTTTIKTQNTNIKTDTEKISADTTKLKSDLEDLTTWTENNSVTAVKEKVDDISTKVDYIKNKDNEIKSATENIKIDTEGIMTRCDGQSAKLDQILQNQQNTPQIDPTSITSTIVGESEVNLTNLNSKIETTKSDIKGSDDIDLTEINNKLNSLSTYFEDNPIPEKFEEDPFKLNQDYTGYTPGETTFNTTDSIEITKPYILNDEGQNSNLNISTIGIYCEGETFNAKVILDVETIVSNAKLVVNFLDTKIDSTNYTYRRTSLVEGRNIISETFENVAVLNNGSYIRVSILQGNKSKINSIKIEVTGKNIAILTRPFKYKVFSKYGETIISKIENYNGYSLTLKTNDITPASLKKNYVLEEENVRDYVKIVGSYTYVNSNIFIKGPKCQAFLTLDGRKCSTTGGILYKYSNASDSCETCYAVDNASAHEFMYNAYTDKFHDNKLRLMVHAQIINGFNNPLNVSFCQFTVANFAFVQDCYNALQYRNLSAVVTNKDGTNQLKIIISDNNSGTVDLGIGRNVTAFYDETNKNLIYVYMKVGDKMVKKSVLLTTSTDEENNTVTTGAIIEQKIIGTYDVFYETNSDKYFVIKNNNLYVFKN